MTLGPWSLKRLQDAHPDLARLVMRASEVSLQSFIVGETLRSKSDQAKRVAEGKSLTLNSRHLAARDGKSRAVDLVAVENKKAVWDMASYRRIAAAMFQASGELNIPLEWGGDWKKLVDGPHFQLPWSSYPR